MKKVGLIGVLMGGCSSEREISLKSGNAVYNGLKESGEKAVALDINTTDENEIIEIIKQSGIDIAFIALHGEFGEDGTLQSILEKHDIIYTGSNSEASRIAISKVLTKNILNNKGFSTPAYKIINNNADVNLGDVVTDLGGFPVIIKPGNEGSSIGISLVKDNDNISEAMDYAFKYGQEIIIEEYILGREFTVGILDNKALPVLEIKPKNTFFNYQSKYEKGMTEYIVPADIPPEVASRVQRTALDVFHLVGCRDFARIDFILNNDFQDYILEINTIPGFTSTSLLPMAASSSGIDFKKLCKLICQLAVKR